MIESRTGLPQVYDICPRDHSAASKRMAMDIYHKTEDFTEIQWVGGGECSADLIIKWRGLRLGVMRFEDEQELGLRILRFLWIYPSAAGRGVGSFVLSELKKRRIYCVARPAPLKIETAMYFKETTMPAGTYSDLQNEEVRISEISDKEKRDRLRRFYIRNGYQPCHIDTSEHLFVTSYPRQMAGILEFITDNDPKTKK
jgi:hypothetical protein